MYNLELSQSVPLMPNATFVMKINQHVTTESSNKQLLTHVKLGVLHNMLNI